MILLQNSQTEILRFSDIPMGKERTISICSSSSSTSSKPLVSWSKSALAFSSRGRNAFNRSDTTIRITSLGIKTIRIHALLRRLEDLNGFRDCFLLFGGIIMYCNKSFNLQLDTEFS